MSLFSTAVSSPELAGTLIKNGDQYTYTPPENYSGPVEFTFIVSDQNGGYSFDGKAVFNLAAVNDLPELTRPNELTNLQVDEDGSMRITSNQLLEGFTDADNNTLDIIPATVKAFKDQ